MAKKKMGRPKIKMDWDTFDQLCGLQCTVDEIAAVMKISVDTIERKCKEERGATFAVIFKEKRNAGKASLRRTQFVLSKKNPAMAIFLGKNYLGQSDKQEIEAKITGSLNLRNALFDDDMFKDSTQ